MTDAQSSKHILQWFAEAGIVVLTIAIWASGVERVPGAAMGFLIFSTFASVLIVIGWGDALNRGDANEI